MSADELFARGYARLRAHPRARVLASRITRPLRYSAMPVLSGAGRGLRVRVGPSTLMRIFSRIEPDVEVTFLSLLQPGAAVYDIGANIGWFSLLAARVVGPAGQVVAFEPSLMNACLIRTNAITNRLSNVVTIPVAVSDHDGWARFLTSSSLTGRLGTSGTDRVPVISVDHWRAATDERAPQVIKIDVEGAEVSVLRGMANTLASCRPTLVIELHDTAEEVADALDAAGYRHRLIETSAPTRNAVGEAHVLATPAEIASA